MSRKSGACMGIEKIQIDQKYIDEAIRLANEYPALTKEVKFQEELRQGKELLNKDDVIEELTGGAVRYDSERVQTSNLSNIPERVTMLIMDGYVEKRNEQLRKELMVSDLDLANMKEQIDTVETALFQMDKFDRAIFQRLYFKKMTYKDIKLSCKRQLYNQQIARARDRAVSILAKEVMIRSFYRGE